MPSEIFAEMWIKFELISYTKNNSSMQSVNYSERQNWQFSGHFVH